MDDRAIFDQLDILEQRLKKKKKCARRSLGYYILSDKRIVVCHFLFPDFLLAIVTEKKGWHRLDCGLDVT